MHAGIGLGNKNTWHIYINIRFLFSTVTKNAPSFKDCKKHQISIINIIIVIVINHQYFHQSAQLKTAYAIMVRFNTCCRLRFQKSPLKGQRFAHGSMFQKTSPETKTHIRSVVATIYPVKRQVSLFFLPHLFSGTLISKGLPSLQTPISERWNSDHLRVGTHTALLVRRLARCSS